MHRMFEMSHLASCLGCHTAAKPTLLLVAASSGPSSSVSLGMCQEWGREVGSFFL